MKDVRTYHESFENRDDSVEAQYQPKPPFIVSAKGDRKHWTNQSDHASKSRDDLQETSEDRPKGCKRDLDQFQTDKPENAYDQGIQSCRAPPVNQRSSRGSEMCDGPGSAVVHTTCL